ncbi:PIN domain-containing protein [Sandaracinobacteroides saxicola]|uniref:PIN domain-containing protein n=1 Tax=Sandaracinobacteroides saxicola TaxID=2759707 RepID=UPI001FB1849E|nr:PIN domain-containing protein [Sandaracinobacteroides saxicola]
MPLALLDSNVIVASVAAMHEDHAASVALFERYPANSFAVAAHSYAETYVTLTKRGTRAPFGWDAQDAWAALEAVAAATRLVGLSAAGGLDGVRLYAGQGNVGARLHDWLIGQSAVLARIPAIVTWNAGPMAALFPGLRVETPAGFVGGR